MNVIELTERLRYSRYEHDNGIGDEAADALEAQALEIERLCEILKESLGRTERMTSHADQFASRLAAAERERDSWRREAEANAEDAAHCGLYAHRLAVALDLLRQHGIHVEYKWCWCEPTVADHREGK